MSKQPGICLERISSAPASVVYDLLADLGSHLEWAGTKQRSDFRLLSLAAPDGAAQIGSIFSSTGSIPMSARRWHDRSTVTLAERPSRFEFKTEARAGDGDSATVATYAHRYDIEPTADGCRVTYRCTQEAIERPMLRLRLPVIRDVMWRVGIPMFAGRGFRNLIALSEVCARSVESATP